MGKELKDLYVDDLAEATGYLFEKLCKEKNDMNIAVPLYMKSTYRENCDIRHPKYATSFSSEQKEWLEKEYKLKKVKKLQYDPILCNWIGAFYTYYQSIKKIPSSKIIEQLPFNEMYVKSKGLHDLSPKDAVERMKEVFEENNKKYYIMHKNEKVIEFTKDINDITSFKVINKDLLPLCVKDNSKLNRVEIMNWLDNRKMPQSRQTTQFIMKIQHIREYNKLFENSLYLSLSDYYWVKPFDKELKWEDVNFFDNSFSNELSDLILLGEKSWDNNDLDIFTENPSKNTNGELNKCWKIVKGKRKLIKRTMLNNNQDVFTEVVISKVLKKYGYNVVDYDLIKIDDEYCCICDTMCQDGWELLQAEYYNKDLKEYIKEFPSFIDIAFIDYVIGNFDRHGLNFGLLRKRDGNKWEYKEAPIYDNECALWSKFREVRDTPYNFSDKIKITSMEDIIKTLQPICNKKVVIKNGIKNIAKDIYELWQKEYQEVVSKEFIESRSNEIQKRIEKTN